MANVRPQQDSTELNCVSESGRAKASGDLRRPLRRKKVKTKLKNRPSAESLQIELEGEVIPRLMLAHNASIKQRFDPVDSRLSLERIVQARELSRLAIGSDADAVQRYINVIVASGVPLDVALVEVVGGAARHLGVLWESDDLNFVDVTIGVSKLQQALRRLSIDRQPPVFTNGGNEFKAAFAPAKGEQHTFGLIMVGEAFRCSGWDVWAGSELDCENLLRVVSEERIDLAGLSLACEDRLDQLITDIDALRSSSYSADLVIIVGGFAFLNNPELWKSTGADGMAADAIEAIHIGEKLVKGGQRRLV